jgi:hypothetical protein
MDFIENFFFFQMEAAGGGHVEVTQVLLDHGAGTNNPSKDSKIIRIFSLSSDFFCLENGNKTDEMHTGKNDMKNFTFNKAFF